MTAFIIRRLMQAGVVVVLMSFIVFSGVFLVGNPVDILISDEADEEDRGSGAVRPGAPNFNRSGVGVFELWMQFIFFFFFWDSSSAGIL